MAFRIDWSDESLRDLQNIINYLIIEREENSWIKFLLHFASRIKIIKEHPDSFQMKMCR